MTIPTREEIRAAHDGIEADGPVANTTLQLTAIVQLDPTLRAVVNRLKPAGAPLIGEALIMAAIATGLNYGLRIHEQRMGGEMTPEDKLAVLEEIASETRALYEGMSADELLMARAAFEADYRDDLTDRGKHFCRGRLALIAELLAARRRR